MYKNRKLISCLALMLLSIHDASAKVMSNLPTTVVEEDVLVLSGKKLDTGANPLTVVVKTADGSSTTLSSTALSKNKVSVTMPSVSADTKVLVQISGGNIPSSSPEQFVVLILDRPNIAGLDTQSNGAVALPDTASSDLHASSSDTAETVTAGIQSAITALPILASIGTSGVTTTVKGNLVVSGFISGNATSATTANTAAVANNFSGSLAGDVTGTQGATSISATTVTGKALTGFSAAAGTVAASDSILSAFNKVLGNAAVTDAALTSVNGKLATTTSGLASVNGKLATTDATVAGHTTTLSSHASSLSSQASSISTLNTNVAANSSAITTNTANIATNTTNIAANTSSISSVNGKLAITTAGLASVNGKLLTTTSGLSSVNGKLATATSDIATVNGELATVDSLVASHTSTLSSHSSTLSSHTSSISTLNTNVSANTSSITALNTAISALNGDVVALNGTVSALNGDVVALNGAVAALNGDVVALYTTVTSVNGDLTTLEATVAAHTTAIAGKQAADADLDTWATKTAPSGTVVGTTDSQALTNKLLQDSTVSFADNSDISKVLKFEVSGITTGTTRTVTVPDASGTMTLLGNSASGTGDIVLTNSPALVTPSLGVATATSINKVTISQPATTATLALANDSSLNTVGAYGVTLNATNTTNLTLPVSGTLATTGDLTAKQDYDAGLTSLAAQDGSANKIMYTTGANTYAATDITALARTNLAAGAGGTIDTSTLVSATYDATNVGFVMFTDNTNIANDITTINGGVAGQRLVIVAGTTSNVIRLVDGSNLKIAGNTSLGTGDTIELISDGTNWYEIARANN